MRIPVLILLLLGICFSASLAKGETAAADAYVKVRQTKIRVAPQPWADAVSSAQYGDRLSLLESAPSWAKVKNASGKQGFVSVSAITPQKVVLASQVKSLGAGVDSADVVLAGKGFSKDVEKEFAKSNQKVNFAEVDRMESIRVGEKDVRAFMLAGMLSKN